MITADEAPREKPPEPIDDSVSIACDRCGITLVGHLCKLVCPNCGLQYDCSDLSLNFD